MQKAFPNFVLVINKADVIGVKVSRNHTVIFIEVSGGPNNPQEKYIKDDAEKLLKETTFGLVSILKHYLDKSYFQVFTDMLQLSTLKRRLKTLLNEFERARKIWDELNDYGLTFANSLILQYSKMKMQIMQMEFLLEEACESLGDEFVYNTPLYLTCTLEVFVHNAINIFSMFTKEIDLKLKIGNSIQQTIINIEYDQIIVLLSTWLNQPYVDNDKIKEFENICEIELIE
ncbi:90_t:CDS:2 [Diversispora eburnea]|uniref:90_t:CDS:1 n=1 Tax=Diversispora eburnea TaxID=1213867 RepID=A0A9N8VT76_9GLOM|nr:90_t:CDS:2 [Diversispora eburnea]